MDLFCTNCGNQRTAVQRFCGSCGAALGAPAAQPSPVSEEQGFSSSELTIDRPIATPVGVEHREPVALLAAGSGGLGRFVNTLLLRPPAHRALIAAAATTVLSVLLAVSVDTYFSSGVARALPLVAVALLMWSALPSAVPGARADRRIVVAVTAVACAGLVVVHQTFDQWGIARVLVSTISGFAYGATASAAQLSARHRSPLTVVSMAGGPVGGALGAVMLNIVDLTDFGVWRLDLDLILSSAFVCALPVGAAVLAWSTPARSASGSAPVAVAQGQAHVALPASGNNGLAIASLVCGLIGVSIPAIVLGHIALSQIKTSGGRQGGRGMAIAGLVLGYLAVAVVIVVFVLLGVFAASLDSGGY